MAGKKNNKKQRGPGQPKKVLTPSQIRKMQNLAYSGCQNNTILDAMGLDHNLIQQRPDIKKLLTKKRAERKIWLREQQDYRVENDKSPAMAVFIGKQELGQADKTEHELTGKDGAPIAMQIINFGDVKPSDNSE